MSRILLVAFTFCSMLGIHQASNAGEFENNTYIESTDHFMPSQQAFGHAEADTMYFSPSVSILSSSESYDIDEHSTWQALPAAHIGINAQWQPSTQFSLNSFIKHQQYTAYPAAYASHHAVSERQLEYASNHQEYTVLGSEVIMHQLFNNKLIIGMNYQMTLPLLAQSNTSNQQLRTYANFQLIENLNLHLDWMISANSSPSSQNWFTQGKLSKPKSINEIYSQLVLFSVSYKM
ncbi:MtrB/PioB family outer membrane beta-barrel protein [Shewanella subflava]|uniref:DUF2490 domain-containing protein n=1 Tax=Shewanella subflava TaxID=2986476 RepID=A0ABT3I4W4_9GAMM|nr:MtrB/PioB family outer membrane beta-barrel protein [Shewanella subflava]MCW3171085.1 hypothetical protein [Shewanella subflava]